MKVRDKIKNAICGESRNISVSKYKKNRKYAKRKYSVLKYGLLTVVASATLLGGIYSYFGGLGTGKCANINEFKKYAVTVENLSIPEQAKIVALGEATHGNKEFQQLKLDIFKIMVEDYGVRAFSLEGDYGGCEAVNRYIHGGDGTVKNAVLAIGFVIYQTEEMENLISWMREYNKSAAQGNDIRFYGFDMQRREYNYQYLLEAVKNAGMDAEELEKIWNQDKLEYTDGYTVEQREKIIEDVKREFEEKDTLQNASAVHLADVLLQNMELGKYIDDAGEINIHRDTMMAENIMWILKQKEARGNGRIFISGHNGHVKKSGSYDANNKVMGNLLADEIGNEYFVIGTDFYKTTCNLPVDENGKRKNHIFYSYDPMAKASKKIGFDISYLDFEKIPDSSELKKQVFECSWMGSLGEIYSALYRILPRGYRVWASPAELYDAMIYVSDAHPIEVIED